MLNPHRVLIVGVGSIGERHLRCFQNTQRCDLAVVEINPALAATISNRCDVSHYPDLDAALDFRPTAAVICTPAHLHIPQAIALADAGIHLLIEKPLSTSTDDLDELRRIVKARRLTAAAAYVLRAHPLLASMRAALREDGFGRPLQLLVTSGQHFPTYRPTYQNIYYAIRATGGGAIQDALTHLVNLGDWLVGPIDRLVADAAHLALEGVEVEDTVHLLARHGRVMASYTLNQHQAPNETTVTVICERGTARFEAHNRRWCWMTAPETAWQEESLPALERDEVFVRQAHAFLDAVEGKGAPLCTLAEGERTLRVNLAALSSADEIGGWVRV